MLLHYGAVTTEKRFELVRLIYEENLGIKEASQSMGVNYQTAKSIIRRFRQTGKIERVNRILTTDSPLPNASLNDSTDGNLP